MIDDAMERAMNLQPLQNTSIEISTERERLTSLEQEAAELLALAGEEQMKASEAATEIASLTDLVQEALTKGGSLANVYQERCEVFQVSIVDRREKMSALQDRLEGLQDALGESAERLSAKTNVRDDRQKELLGATRRYFAADRELERLRTMRRPDDTAAIRNYEQPEDILVDAVGRPQAAVHEQELNSKVAAKREAESQCNEAEAKLADAEDALQQEVSHYQGLEVEFRQGQATIEQLATDMEKIIEKIAKLQATQEQVSRYVSLLRRMTQVILAGETALPAQAEPVQEAIPTAVESAPEVLSPVLVTAGERQSEAVSLHPVSLLVTASRGRHAAPDTARVDMTGSGRTARVTKLLPTNGGTES